MDPVVRESGLAAWPSPPRVLPRHTWEEYARWEGAWELIRGVPYSMSPAATLRHHRALWNLYRSLCHQLEHDKSIIVMSEMDWIVDDLTTIRPDVMVAREPVGDDWLRQPPLLLAEVLSPSTAAKDRIEKRALCEEQGVPWFVLANPETRGLEVFAWSSSGYAQVDAQGEAFHLALNGQRLSLRPETIFPL